MESRVAISRASDFRDSNYGFGLFLSGSVSASPVEDSPRRARTSAMIKEDLIAFAHSAKIISGRKIPNARPTCAAIFDEIAPRIIGWFLLHEPEIFHRFNLTRFDNCRSLFEDRERHGASAFYHIRRLGGLRENNSGAIARQPARCGRHSLSDYPRAGWDRYRRNDSRT